jgi:hypothetical protein
VAKPRQEQDRRDTQKPQRHPESQTRALAQFSFEKLWFHAHRLDLCSVAGRRKAERQEQAMSQVDLRRFAARFAAK